MKKMLVPMLTLLIAAVCVLPLQAQDCCVGRTGNTDCDPTQAVDGSDLSVLIDHLFINLTPLCCEEEAEMDGLPEISGGDLSVLINHLFITYDSLPFCGTASPSGSFLSRVGCKEFTQSKDDTPSNQDCIKYDYDGVGTLSFSHINAGFNCCTDVAFDITIEDNLINIVPAESGEFCYCLCLFDVELEIVNLPPGEYTIAVTEPCLIEGDEPMVFTADLSEATTGEYCLLREHYPWNVLTNSPSGSMTGITGCKSFPPGEKDGTPPDQDCIEWNFNGSGLLELKHVNAGFNCCPELDFVITIEGDVITIEEIEIEGLCDCLCLFDIDFEIVNVTPGMYQIVVIEPYAQYPDEDPLEFMIDLTSTPAGSYCVQRGHYPWGQQ